MLGPSPLPRTLAAALRDVGSKRPEVRADAVRDLLRYSDESRPEVIRALQGVLRDADPRVRGLAATALSDAGAKEALPALLTAVEDEDAFVRQMAISALGELGDARATERLRRALSDTRPEVRFQAVIAFPRVAARRADAIDAVLTATRDQDPLVVHIALRVAEENSDGEIDERLIERARELLSHDAVAVRVAAAILLARTGDPSGHDLVVRVAAGDVRTGEGEDEAAAIELCGELGLPGAERGLERRAFGGFLGLGRDRFQWHARVALARAGHERATLEIVAELSSWDRERRTLAVAAVGRAQIASARETLLSMRDAPEKADPDAVEEALRALGRKPAR